jgi:hypothetical protein
MPKKMNKRSEKGANVTPMVRSGSATANLGKTVVDFEESVNRARVDELLAMYPQPPYHDLVLPCGDGTYNVLILA